ncbi:hypothetical protein CS344_20225 [Bordetella bronchiseptica]|nr:hypothetical protein CS344_20225 [Bordetella bronchiseptica]QBS70776.1 hypothetical protein B2C13_19915 [Bordetella bronchiseptica]
MDTCHGDEQLEVFTSTPRLVMEVLGTPTAWDHDGHDALWWATRLREANFFNNLTDGERMLLLMAAVNSTNTWASRIQSAIQHAVETELRG